MTDINELEERIKKVYVLRHADKNRETGELTDEGKERARALKEKLGVFDLVITSDKNTRLLETAELLTGSKPQIDKRAGLIYNSKEQQEIIGALAKTHPMTHAGVIYDHSEYKELAEKIGKDFIELIKETRKKLPENGRALIVTQDAVMVAGEKQLNNKPHQKLEKNFQPLEGYIITENLKIEELVI